MTKMTDQAIAETVAEHAKWLANPKLGRRANFSGQDLSGAQLTGANLTNADLSGSLLTSADLTGASLYCANLRGASLNCCDLISADLRRANFRGAYLRRANLRGADLDSAELSDADLTGARLAGANLNHAYLSGATLTDANLTNADLTGADLLGYQIPVIPHLDAKIYSRITDGMGFLEMGDWHTCETAHCRAGWAIVVAGAEGARLENEVGPAAAGALIYAVSRPGRLPNFHATDRAAMASIKAGALADPIPAP